MAASSVISLVIRGEDQASGAFRAVTSSLGGVGKVAAGAVVGGTVAAGAAIAGLGALATNEFVGFDQQMREVFTLMPDISQSAMDDMSGQVKDFSSEFGVLPDKVVPSLYQAISAGVPPDNVFSFLETAQMAAAGGVTELETAVDGISSVVNAYGEDVISGAEASDLMFTAVQKGKTTFEELSSSLFQITPQASAAGLGFENVTAALATMTAQGTPTAQATTQMRQLMVELTKSGTEASSAFQEVAGVGMQEFLAQGGNLQDALGVMQQAADDNNVSIADMFGSVEAGNAALALTGSGAEAFGENLEAMQDSTGATQEAFETMDGSLQATLNRLKATGKVALLDFATAFEPLLARGADVVEDLLPKFRDFLTNQVVPAVQTAADFILNTAVPALQQFGDWFRANGLPLLQQFGSFIGTTVVPMLRRFGAWFMAEGLPALQTFAGQVMSQLVPGLQQLFSWGNQIAQAVLPVLGNWFGFLKENINVVIPVVAAVGVAIAALAAPLGLIVGPLVLLATAWANNWGGIQQKTQAVITFLRGLISGALNAIRGWWSAHGASVMTIIRTHMATTRAIFLGALNFIRGLIQTVLGGIQAFWGAFGGTITTMATNTWGLIQTTVTNAMTAVSAIIDAVAAAIKGDWTAFGGHLRRAWNAAWGTVAAILVTAKENLITLVSGLVGQIVTTFTDTDWGQLGSDLIDGLIAGLNAGAGAVIDTIINIASNSLDAIKGFFGIESPSAVMAGVFENVMAGGEVGLQQRGPAVIRAAQRWAGEVEEALRVGAPTIGGANGRFGGRRGRNGLGPGADRSQGEIHYHFGDVNISDPETGRLFLEFLQGRQTDEALATFSS